MPISLGACPELCHGDRGSRAPAEPLAYRNSVLSQARSNLNELEELIDRKLTRKENGRSQVRRRAWAKYRSQLHQTQSWLMGYNATLLTAIANDNS